MRVANPVKEQKNTKTTTTKKKKKKKNRVEIILLFHWYLPEIPSLRSNLSDPITNN